MKSKYHIYANNRLVHGTATLLEAKAIMTRLSTIYYDVRVTDTIKTLYTYKRKPNESR